MDTHNVDLHQWSVLVQTPGYVIALMSDHIQFIRNIQFEHASSVMNQVRKCSFGSSV